MAGDSFLRKMRLTTPKGAANPQAKFTPEEVEALRARFRHSPPPSLRQVARELGVSHPTVTKIVQRISYRD